MEHIKNEMADAIWRELFVENSPISEATRGIIAVLRAFDLPTESSGLEEARSFFYAQNIDAHITRVLQMAGVSTVAMTNDPWHSEEQTIWMNGNEAHPKFHP